MRKGKPPYNVDDWPEDDGAVYRQLVVAQTTDVWGTSTRGPLPGPHYTPSARAARLGPGALRIPAIEKVL